MEPRGFVTALFDYSFTSFVTPKIIKILYVLATIVVSLSTLVLVLAAFSNSSSAGILTLVIAGPLFFLLSMIYARVSRAGDRLLPDQRERSGAARRT